LGSAKFSTQLAARVALLNGLTEDLKKGGN
jgi:hypothetical protein